MTAGARANEITYQCLGLAAVTVHDGDAADDDPLASHVLVHFDQTVVGFGFSWRATGTLIGIADPPFSASATTRLEDLTIQNLEGNCNDQIFTFSHTFPQLGPPLPVNNMSISGHFDNLDTPGWLNGGFLSWSAWVTWPGGTEPLGGGATGFIGGPAPINFAGAGGPVAVIHPTAHNASMLFYLDSPGDAILMGEGEGWDMDAVPAPGTCVLLVVASAFVRRRRSGVVRC
jgi:hypothetical protein